MQTPGPLSQQAEPDVEGARLIIESALAHGRHLLNEVESKALLAAFHIPIAQTQIARNP
ncbi:MAG: long-chain fatty-acid-CoA ligase, partial [Proteobacteria bacterium]|nr:long-chain fatty-acid-CoA ligase [Pseudomonadota bacterium]